jgi:hypothetical protein
MVGKEVKKEGGCVWRPGDQKGGFPGVARTEPAGPVAIRENPGESINARFATHPAVSEENMD